MQSSAVRILQAKSREGWRMDRGRDSGPNEDTFAMSVNSRAHGKRAGVPLPKACPYISLSEICSAEHEVEDFV